MVRVEGTILLKYIDKVLEILSWFKRCSHKQTVQYYCSTMRHILITLTYVYPLETQCTSNNLNFTDDSEFAKYLPIRDWGINGELKNISVKYHIPNEEEIKCAIGIVKTFSQSCIDYLTSNNENINKDERYSELGILYSIIVGSSRLLKRANRPLLQDQ